MDLDRLSPMRILVANAGSSSLKLSVVECPEDGVLETGATVTLTGEELGMDLNGLRRFVDGAGVVDVVGHRIVHGGTEFTRATVVDEAVRRRLESLVDLAPLHQPASLKVLDAVSQLLPGVTAVACFDTAFHATIPPAAATYALPREWRIRWPLRRFGFHGLSHAYSAARAAELVNTPIDELRIVTCHLGSGASVAAVAGGRSVDTTMGFTPLEGLVMATRSGSVDPGLVLWLQEHVGMPAAELADTLERRSGLQALTGSSDMRRVLEAEAQGDPDASLGLDVYLHRLRGAVAAMAAAMGGLDVLVFTGGVGEHSAPIRGRVASGLHFLGVGVDADRNQKAEPDVEIGESGSPVRVLVVSAREDLRIAQEAVGLLG
jgi:acetate kinase